MAATVLSVGHVQSLFVESQCTAPGEKVQFLGVRYVSHSVPSLFFLCQMVSEHYYLVFVMYISNNAINSV